MLRVPFPLTLVNGTFQVVLSDVVGVPMVAVTPETSKEKLDALTPVVA